MGVVAAGDVADGAGWKVAMKGVRIGVGKTIGVPSTVTLASIAPSSTVVEPVAGTD